MNVTTQMDVEALTLTTQAELSASLDLSIVELREVSFGDGFADEHGEPTGDLGVTMAHIIFEPRETGTRVTIVSGCDSVEQLEEMAKMGMEKGICSAVGQMQAILDEE